MPGFGQAMQKVSAVPNVDPAMQKKIDDFAKKAIQNNTRDTNVSGNEHGGYIYLKDGELALGPQFAVVDGGLAGGNPDSSLGKAVAWWHTHPMEGGQEVGIGDSDSPDRGHYFSALDYKFSQDHNIPGYVGSSDNHFVRYDPSTNKEVPLGWIFP